jgi:RHS repeat-associated protein
MKFLNHYTYDRGPLVAYNQILWRETYAYDANGNRAAKTTPWGTIAYSYDAENRMARKGDIAYTYDRDGNLLSEKGLRREAEYRYSGANRMTWSSVTDHVGRTRTASSYAYDAFGRRTAVRDEGGESVRTLYDGFTFEAVREGAMFRDGTFTTKFSSGVEYQETTGAVGTRYRWLGGEEASGVRTQRIEGDAYAAVTARYAGTGATLYGNGEAVAVSRSAGVNTRGGTAYLGKDVLGSVRGVSNEWGQIEERYEYDAFGKSYKGDFSNGVNLGYTGKPYDTVTGLYNYGYRDYQPEVARFTTVDPVRDGANWFAYVNNDPVNYTDPLGLTASDKINNALVSFSMESPNINGLSATVKAGEYEFDFVNNVGSSAIGGKVSGLSYELTQTTPIGTFSFEVNGLTASANLGFSNTGSVIPGLTNIGVQIGASAAYGELNLNYEHDSGWYGGIGLSNGIGFQFTNNNGEFGIDIRAFGIHVSVGKK